MTGLFADLQLFPEALGVALNKDYVTRFDLEEELSRRVHGVTLVERESPRRWSDLIRELRYFGWIKVIDTYHKPTDDARHKITEEGVKVYSLWKKEETEFLRLLTIKMHNQYVIPGWFVQRLWDINPERGGEVVMPNPLREEKFLPRKWDEKAWTEDLKKATRSTYESIESNCPGSFPIEENIWLSQVEDAWKRLSNLRRREVSRPSGNSGKEKEKVKTYAPRGRLAQAMTEASVKLLFGTQPPNIDRDDFLMRKEPISPRLYSAWCPRLEALELIFYTDAHLMIPGRLLFPTSVFRESTPPDFQKINLKNPKGNTLCLYQPTWKSLKENFFETLYKEHHKVSARVGSLYAPLLDVRDEVCRQLRLSANLFDNFLLVAIKESLMPKSRFSISVETDVREDQRMAYRILRRPVWLHGTPYSLIAMTEYRDK